MNRRFLPRLTEAIICRVTLLLVWQVPLHAQPTNPLAATYPPNRYLLVVETSRSMQRRSEGMIQAARDFLESGLASQARRGDSLGVWTFNEELYTGLLPLQEWSPENQKAIAQHVNGFLRAQKLEKGARLDKVVPALNHVVKNSPFLTVLLVCCGEEELHGTPFDQRINGFFQSWRLQQQDARAPFVVALRAQAGAFVDCSMNPTPWRNELPALPKELFVPIPIARAPQPTKPITSTVPPLIISGRKREPLIVTNPQSPAATVGVSTSINPVQQVRPDSTSSAAPAVTQKAAETSSTQAALATSTSPPPAFSGAPVPADRLLQPESSKSSIEEPKNVQSTITANGAGTTAAPPLTLPPATQGSAKTSPVQPLQPLGSYTGGPVVESANVSAGTNPGRSRILLIAGSLVLLAILAGIWISRLRSRSARREVSLITESIHRRKP